MHLTRLPLKLTGGQGQGAISVEELDEVFRINSDRPLLKPGTVIHTDSAKSYKRLGPMRWDHCRDPDHPLYTGALQTRYSRFGYTHTNVSPRYISLGQVV